METTQSPRTETTAVPDKGRALPALLATFTSPSRAFAEMERGAHWIVPLLVSAVLAIAGVFIAAPAQEIAFQASAQQMTPEQMAMGRKIATISQVVFMPIALVLFGLLEAALLRAGAAVAGAGVRFGLLFRLVSYLSVIGFGLPVLLSSILTRLRWNAGSIEGVADLQPRMGLDLLGGTGLVRGILGAFNVFSIVWIVLVVLGVAAFARRPAKQIALPIVVVCLLMLLLGGLMSGWGMARQGA